jgi:hypothetical protein
MHILVTLSQRPALAMIIIDVSWYQQDENWLEGVDVEVPQSRGKLLH